MGISLRPGGLGFAHIRTEAEGPPRLEACEFLPCNTPEERVEALSRAVRERRLAGAPCVCVLASADYQIRLVERPDVEAAEIRDAVRWQLQELMDLEAGSAYFDVCDFPEDSARGRNARIYVAAARGERIRQASELVAASGMKLCALDIPEFAQRNIASALPSAVAGTALLTLGDKQGLLTLCHEGYLYLARGISTGLRQLESLDLGGGDGSQAGAELPEDSLQALDALLLEIQRSLDYYESELGKAPASRLMIGPCELEPSLLLPRLEEQLRPVRVRVLDLSELVRAEETLSQELQAQTLDAIGAALRGGEPQQLNLAAEHEVETETPVSIQMLLRVCTAMLLALALIQGIGWWQLSRYREDVEDLKRLRDAGNERLRSFEQKFPIPDLDPELEARVRALRGERDAKTRLLRGLASKGGARTRGLSDFLEGLARRPVEGLWLREISVRDGGEMVSMVGSAVDPELVPHLLHDLAGEQAFSGKRFAVLRMASSDHEGVIDFSLSARPEEEGGP